MSNEDKDRDVQSESTVSVSTALACLPREVADLCRHVSKYLYGKGETDLGNIRFLLRYTLLYSDSIAARLGISLDDLLANVRDKPKPIGSPAGLFGDLRYRVKSAIRIKPGISYLELKNAVLQNAGLNAVISMLVGRGEIVSSSPKRSRETTFMLTDAHDGAESEVRTMAASIERFSTLAERVKALIERNPDISYLRIRSAVSGDKDLRAALDHLIQRREIDPSTPRHRLDRTFIARNES